MAKEFGFGREELAARFPNAALDGQGLNGRGGRHGRGFGLRPSRYIGRHRNPEETTEHREKASRWRGRKARDYGFGR